MSSQADPLLPPASIVEANEIRPTHVVVDLGAIERNLQGIQAHVGQAEIMPIIKANAYGHGLIAVAKKLQSIGIERVGVAYLEEALALRSQGVSLSILVMGGPVARQLPTLLEHDLSITVPSVKILSELEKVAKRRDMVASVHLKVDTGMGRLGVHYQEADQLLEAAEQSEHVSVDGVYSHFANADAADLSSAREQLERFEEVCGFYERHSLATPMRHIANSGAVLQLPEAHLDLVRPGIMIYGVYPSLEAAKTVTVEPALRWLSSVVFEKEILLDSPVSYGSTWTAPSKTRVATVPVGYGDGYMRSMSGSAEVIISEKRFPAVGRICMDQFVVDVGSQALGEGREVVLIGGENEDRISAETLAGWADTIPYEILTGINARVPRIYVDSPRE